MTSQLENTESTTEDVEATAESDAVEVNQEADEVVEATDDAVAEVAEEEVVEQADKSEAKKGKGGKRGWKLPRRIVQVCALVLFVVPVLCAGWLPLGLTASSDYVIGTPAELPFFGSLSSSSIGPITLVDPFAYLQVIVASKSIQIGALVGALIILVIYGLIRGRVFCGWVCPVNLLLELEDKLRGKLGIKVAETVLPRHVKVYVAAAILVLSLILCVPVYEIFNPIGLINKGLVFGGMTGLVTLIAIIFVELFWGHRVWCRSICPLGGFWEVVGKVGFVNVHMDHEACIACDKCKAACLCDPVILDDVIAGEASVVKAGDCMVCGACVDACPTEALSLGIGRKSRHPTRCHPLGWLACSFLYSDNAVPVIKRGSWTEITVQKPLLMPPAWFAWGCLFTGAFLIGSVG